MRAWAADGHASLREISHADVLAALPPSGNPRSTLSQGRLRSIFTILKTEKVIFASWTAAANPHLFIHKGTASSTRALGRRWLRLLSPLPVRIIGEYRILQEIHATGGDVRHVCDLFGLTVAVAMRYAATLDHSAIKDIDSTHGPSPTRLAPNSSSRRER
jgi:hypothetical protein